MLRNDLYTSKILSNEGSEILAELVVNENHPIFDGHFPGNKILPGVCMIAIMKELLEDHVEEELRIVTGSNVKFTAVLNPEVNSVVNMNIIYRHSAEGYNVKTVLKFGEINFFSFTGVLQSALHG